MLLHVFVSGTQGGGGDPQTHLKGYFFAESISRYRLTPW